MAKGKRRSATQMLLGLMPKLACQLCGTQFQTRTTGGTAQKFCSRKCTRKAQRQRRQHLIRQYISQYQRDNKTKIYAQKTVYRAANIERVRAWRRSSSKAYALRYPDRVRLSARLSAARHPESKKARRARRRALELGATGSFTAVEWNQLLAEYDYCCGYCGKSGIPLEADHRTPLLRGGTGFITNVIPACRSCNSHKQTMTEEEFRARQVTKATSARHS